MAKKDKRNRKGNSVFKDYWIRLLVICILCLVVLKMFLPKFGSDFLSITEFFSAKVDETFGLGLNFLSTVGEFVGGVIGTILTFLSVIILTITFIQQKKVTEANIKQQDLQRFNDMFYELLRLYREQVDSLSLEKYEVKKIGKGEEKVVYKGKDFFNWHKKDLKKRMYEQIIDKIYEDIIQKEEVISEVNKKELTEEDIKKEITKVLSENKGIHEYNNNRIRKLYIDFYVENREKIAPYFRILYRILELIDTSPLLKDSEYDKQAYAKILRAQLTESELFFLRYNVKYIMYGENLIKYINHYNILKHLPVFELLNFQIFRNDKNNSKDIEECVNEIFYKVCKALRDGKKEDKKRNIVFESNSKNYKIEIEGKEGDKEIKIIYKIDASLEDKYFEALESIRKDKGNVLFEYFMEEIFKDSNFREYNEGAEISIEPLSVKDNTTYIISKITSPNPIQIKYNHEKKKSVFTIFAKAIKSLRDKKRK